MNKIDLFFQEKHPSKTISLHFHVPKLFFQQNIKIIMP
jgi:hypothetical protein